MNCRKIWIIWPRSKFRPGWQQETENQLHGALRWVVVKLKYIGRGGLVERWGRVKWHPWNPFQGKPPPPPSAPPPCLLPLISKHIIVTSYVLVHYAWNDCPYKCLIWALVCCLKNTCLFKGIVSDSNSIFLWQQLEDYYEKRFISKISVHSNFLFRVMHDYAHWYCSIDDCVK